MNASDLMFPALILMGLTSATVIIVQLVRGRRGRGSGSDDGRAGWWEGPWDDDDRRR